MQVSTRSTDDTLYIQPSGTWTIDEPLPDLEPVTDKLHGPDPVTTVSFDTSELNEWDSSLVTFLFETVEHCQNRGIEVRTDALPPSLERLLSLSQAVPEQDTDTDRGTENVFARVGEWAFNVYDEVLDIIVFTGRTVLGLWDLMRRRARMRWRTFGVALQSSTSSALPIVTVISLLVGLILAFLGAVVLRRFGADYFVSYLVSYGMLRELGALMTAIIMTGRTGAAYAAELGSMKINEEIDALETLGISPINFLVLPRMLAVVVAMPLLVVYADALGIFGGMAVAVTLLDLTATQFLTGLLEPVVLADGLIGILKGTVYGAIIGLSGCMRGLQTGNDASAVGTSTTSAVVTGIILIVLANAVIDWLAAII